MIRSRALGAPPAINTTSVIFTWFQQGNECIFCFLFHASGLSCRTSTSGSLTVS